MPGENYFEQGEVTKFIILIVKELYALMLASDILYNYH